MFGRRKRLAPYAVPLGLLTAALCSALCSWAAGIAAAQDRLPTMPGYARYLRISRDARDAARSLLSANLFVTWSPDGKTFDYQKDGKWYRYEIATHQSIAVKEEAPRGQTGRRSFAGDFPAGNFPAGNFPGRGRQFAVALSPDGKHKAFYKEANLWLSDADNTNARAITTDGSQQKRIKYGTASWVYGEELNQQTAMWWSPDSKKVAYYRFDESQVPDYYVTLHQLQVQSALDAEPYPKAGANSPVVDLFIYDLETQQTVHVDVRDGKPFANDVIGHYVYNVRWSPDGSELLFNRTNRRQNTLEVAACRPDTGRCRVVVREEWPASWTDNHPNLLFLTQAQPAALKAGPQAALKQEEPQAALKEEPQAAQRFILRSERSGWHNLYLYDLTGQRLATLTHHAFEVEQVVQVNEHQGVVFYMARSGDNPMKLQLHRVKLDGTGDKRLTDPTLNHRVQVAPDGAHFIDIAQTHAQAPVMRLMDAEGNLMETLVTSDVSKMTALGLQTPELFTYKAADGKTDLYGLLMKPSNFDPTKKYPLLVDVYAGPESNSLRETFAPPLDMTEMGFLVAQFDGRGTQGRGKRFQDELYGKLGRVEIDDQAAGVTYLRQRPYVDGTRVGVFGASYGGYASVMCLLRYPDLFQAACASSSVTDWRNYDSIYTERYMGLPQDNQAGYEAGSAMTYAKDLHGKLMLFFGTADNNVHPSNTLQLISALLRAGKSYELQVGPDMGHSGLGRARMLEFFMDNLVLSH